LTVDEAVGAALKQNPGLTAAAREVTAARAGASAAGALANLGITLAPSIAGPAGSDEELLVTQPLEVNGARGARRRGAEAELRVAQSQARTTARDLVRDVKQAYYELARAREVLELQQESVSTAEEFERIARRQVELGARPGIDLTQLQVEVARARQLRTQAEGNARLAAASLNTLMGRASDTPIGEVSLPASSAAASPASPTAETAVERRGEVAAQQARLEALEQQARSIRAEGRPDLAVQGRVESFSDTPRVGGLALSITLPLIDYGGRRNRLRQNQSLVESQAARVEATRRQVRLDVERSLIRLRTAQELVRQYTEGLLDQARRLAEAERTRFTTGAGSPLTVLEAQRTYRAVLSDYYGALAAQAQALADLEWATGSFDPPAGVMDPPRGAAREGRQ
jgi:outer membrane protein TolC